MEPTADMLLKLCRMLGSDFDGERAVAALKATELLRRSGLSWDDVVALPGSSRLAHVQEGGPSPTAAYRPRSGSIYADWRADLACCHRHRSRLSMAEREYVDQLRAIMSGGRATVRAEDGARLGTLARRLRRELSSAE